MSDWTLLAIVIAISLALVAAQGSDGLWTHLVRNVLPVLIVLVVAVVVLGVWPTGLMDLMTPAIQQLGALR